MALLSQEQLKRQADGLDHIKEFETWLTALVRRHKAAVFVHYSTSMARWHQQWDDEDKRRKEKK